ncbi:hypothetical protein OIE75_40950 (plasmid) [Streptomyces sp. NBC_01723]|uniref:hypothetical protein n=1 Tax=Streptomyces sp. NBC_01723 TaxID=2975921 RepID=UPI002E329B06|nr:hypothetical protein [Streptomyces sp. NBC_01723]
MDTTPTRRPPGPTVHKEHHMATYEFEAAPYTELKKGDRVKTANEYHGQFVDWHWRIFPVDHIKWLRPDRTALMLYLTQPMPCGDRFALITGRATIEAGTRRIVREITMPRYEVRTLNTDPNPNPAPFHGQEFQPVHYIHDTQTDRPLFGSYTDRSDADDRCNKLNNRT